MAAPVTIFLHDAGSRRLAGNWIASAPDGSCVALRPPGRSIPQNARLHAMCTDVARQVEWAGKKRNVEAWKDIFAAALLSATHELDVVPGLNGGFVLLGLHTSEMTVEQCGNMMTIIEAWCAENGVTLSG